MLAGSTPYDAALERLLKYATFVPLGYYLDIAKMKLRSQAVVFLKFHKTSVSTRGTEITQLGLFILFSFFT